MLFQIFQQRFEAFAVDGVAFAVMPVRHALRREGPREQCEEQMKLVFDNQLKSRVFVLDLLYK
ncbi:hypothetical protein D3C79_1089910 [compost metagenome]